MSGTTICPVEITWIQHLLGSWLLSVSRFTNDDSFFFCRMPQIFAIIKQQKTVEQLPLKGFFNGFYIPSLKPNITGWWFGTFFNFSIQLGMSSSQLTNSIIFQRGRLKPPTRSLLTIINHTISININHIWLILIITININHH